MISKDRHAASSTANALGIEPEQREHPSVQVGAAMCGEDV
jgi:hypothetical protein